MPSFKSLSLIIIYQQIKDVTDDELRPFNVPRFTSSSLIMRDHWGLKCCINGRDAVQHYEFNAEVTVIHTCLYSVLFCLSRGTLKNVWTS